jgi:hypothetical protein
MALDAAKRSGIATWTVPETLDRDLSDPADAV